MRDVTVLITACGNVYMPGTAASVKNNGERNIRLIGADMNHDDTILQMFDQYYQVPRGDDPNYANVILDICLKEHVDVVIPIMSAELVALAEKEEMFRKAGVTLSISNLESLKIANNKLALFVAGYLLGEHLWQRGIPVSLGGLLLGFGLIRLLDRYMTRKGNAYMITGLAKGPRANNTEKRG